MFFQSGLVREALLDCQIAHMGQTRKYSGQPYWVHPYEVAGILREHGIEDPALICAALLHDVLEDTDFPRHILLGRYGFRIESLVYDLTDPKYEGNRAERKAQNLVRLAGIRPDAMTVKCADLISNTKDISAHDPGFARVYLREKRDVLNVFGAADPRLLAHANRALETAEATLG